MSKILNLEVLDNHCAPTLLSRHNTTNRNYSLVAEAGPTYPHMMEVLYLTLTVYLPFVSMTSNQITTSYFETIS